LELARYAMIEAPNAARESTKFTMVNGSKVGNDEGS
jgi:hypothetical protein